MKSDHFYESRPFLFLIVGLLAVIFSVSGLMTLAGWTLVACAGSLIHIRMRHRGFIK